MDPTAVSPPVTDSTVELLAYARERRDADNPLYAESLCRRALAVDAESADAHQLLGTVLQAQDRVPEAVEAFQEAIRLDPDNAEAFHLLSIALAELGRLPAAIVAVRASLVIRPGHPGALYHLAHLKKFHTADPDLAMLEAVSTGVAGMDDREATFLYFALAKAYEDVEDYDRSFEHLHRANALKRRTTDYRIEDDLSLMRAVARVFDERLFERLANGGSSSELPVLVVGMPRSGTSLVEQILASHPAIYGAGELAHLDELAAAISVSNPRGVGFPDGVLALPRTELDRFGEAYIASLRRLAPDAQRVTDKNPFNFLYLGLARLMMPNARIIHCTRDPIDTCLSCYRANFKWMAVASDLADLGRYYLAYEELMGHWRRVLAPAWMLELKYEDLVDDFDQHARRIVAHCGLDWDPACLEFHATRRQVRTTSFAQVRRPVYGDAVARWRKYERHLGPLLAALGRRA